MYLKFDGLNTQGGGGSGVAVQYAALVENGSSKKMNDVSSADTASLKKDKAAPSSKKDKVAPFA